MVGGRYSLDGGGGRRCVLPLLEGVSVCGEGREGGVRE